MLFSEPGKSSKVSIRHRNLIAPSQQAVHLCQEYYYKTFGQRLRYLYSTHHDLRYNRHAKRLCIGELQSTAMLHAARLSNRWKNLSKHDSLVPSLGRSRLPHHLKSLPSTLERAWRSKPIATCTRQECFLLGTHLPVNMIISTYHIIYQCFVYVKIHLVISYINFNLINIYLSLKQLIPLRVPNLFSLLYLPTHPAEPNPSRHNSHTIID